MSPPAEHHPELLLKVVMPELPAGSCCSKSRSPLAKACRGGAGPAGGRPRGETLRSTPDLGCREGFPRLAGLPLPCACLKTRFAGSYETQGLRRLCPGFATGGSSPSGKRGFAQRRRSHSRHRFKGTLPGGIGSVLSGRAPRAGAAPLAASGQAPGRRGGSSPRGRPQTPGTKGLRSRHQGCDCGHHRQVTVETPNVEGQCQK